MKSSKRPGVVRQRRAWRVSNRVRRNASRPRLAVFRSNKHIYAQIIDDVTGRTLAAAGSLDSAIRGEIAGGGGNVAGATVVGRLIAERALAAGVTAAAFDRRGYKYHGRVAALADAARDAGLDLGAKMDPEELAAKKKSAKPSKSKGDKAAGKAGKGEKAGKGKK